MSMIVNLILMLVIGYIVGWVARRFVKGDTGMEQLLLGTGVAGSVLGVAVAYVMDFGPYGPIGSAIVCIVGAALLIAALDSLHVFGRPAPVPLRRGSQRPR